MELVRPLQVRHDMTNACFSQVTPHPACAARSFAAFGLPPFEPTPEQCTPDPEFPTVAFPNPGKRDGGVCAGG